MFVEFLVAAKGHKIGDTVEYEDVVAKGLIELDLVKEGKKPAVVESAAAAAATGLQTAMVKAVSDGFAEMAKKFVAQPAVNRGGLEIADNADIQVENLVVHGRLKNFPNDAAGLREAYRFGIYCLGVYHNDPRSGVDSKERSSFAVQRCKQYGIPLTWKEWEDTKRVVKTLTDTNNTSAGFLVPEEFQNSMILLREKYGVFRQNAQVVPMAGDQKLIPRQRGAAQAYFVGEGAAGTATDPTFDLVKLGTKKLMTLTYFSTEIGEDAVISIGDKLAGDIAYAFAKREDQCGFLGDATSTYGGILGLSQSLKNISATPTSTIADVLGIYQTSHNSYATITLADFNQVVGLLPEFADTPNAKWYMHRTVWGSVAQRLATAAGGNPVSAIQDGAREKMFLGYPVIISQVMPKTYAANQIVAYLGDLSEAAMIGDRRHTTIALSDQYLFNQDVIAVRGTERFDINVHDVGEMTTGTPKDAAMGLTAGPMVALMLT